ncbi:MAG: hypothetical protein ACP5L5_08710 [Vulcanisaeta sp.]|uniref:Uncharacterized protein n=1 Tax=Vulcanisaeta moutnovskia (strain 768-28) TaxID=985053 RepID=F0QT12_VULM7|nr:hypothetical protein [Vulcanisaeta moutnovskia]ADY01601.1 hypothetical protein VMUT_1396 [Vulcanisaeta moutnovskia 768-28]
MSQTYPEETQKERTNYLESIINSLAVLASEKIYGPLDVLASTPDPQLAYGVLYNAIRYLASQSYSTPSEEDIDKLFAIASKRPEILREVAIKALIRGVKMRSSNKKEAMQVQTK